jgi:hypothetical protein
MGGIWRIGSKTGGYRGYNCKEKFCVWISGKVQRVTRPIRHEIKRRAAVESVIGHLKDEHRMGRNYLKDCDGDRANAVLTAAGYNFALLLRCFRRLLRALFQALFAPLCPGLDPRGILVAERRFTFAVSWRGGHIPARRTEIGHQQSGPTA